jgi:hypothetical protein
VTEIQARCGPETETRTSIAHNGETGNSKLQEDGFFGPPIVIELVSQQDMNDVAQKDLDMDLIELGHVVPVVV